MGLSNQWNSRQLFAEKVMPSLKNIWPELETDERWWCHPIEDRVRPEYTIESARAMAQAESQTMPAQWT